MDEIVFHGVEAFDEEVLARKMKETKDPQMVAVLQAFEIS